MSKNNEEKVRAFFGKNAEKYSQSKSHAKGEDLNILISHLDPKDKDLAADFATGTGFTAISLSRYVRKVFAIDFTAEMLLEAKKLADRYNISNIEFLKEDVTKTSFNDNFLDIVVTRRAAHHFSDKQSFIAEARRVLKVGGKLGIVDMVTPENDYSRFYDLLEKTRDSSHVEAYKYKDWLAILEKNGFTIHFSEIYSERLDFEGWLYPLRMDSVEGANCLRLLKSLNNRDKETIQFDEKYLTFTKQRAIIIAKKSEFQALSETL